MAMDLLPKGPLKIYVRERERERNLEREREGQRDKEREREGQRKEERERERAERRDRQRKKERERERESRERESRGGEGAPSCTHGTWPAPPSESLQGGDALWSAHGESEGGRGGLCRDGLAAESRTCL